MDQQTETPAEKVTVVNTPPAQKSGDNGMGFLLGIIVLIVVVVLFLVYGLPYVRNLTGGNGVQINVPKSIDVNVNQSK